MITFLVFLVLVVFAFRLAFNTPSRTLHLKPGSALGNLEYIVNRYRFFVYSSGKLRQSLLFSVQVSCLFVILKPFSSEFLENVSYSLIAAFVFDLGINFTRENVSKQMQSKKWHIDIYSGSCRRTAIQELAFGCRNGVTNHDLARFFVDALFDGGELAYAKKNTEVMWSPFSGKYLTYKSLRINEGAHLDFIAMQFLTEDRDFLRDLIVSSEVFHSFPSMLKVSRDYYYSCMNLFARLESPEVFSKVEVDLHSEFIKHLDKREVFFCKADDIMGHYHTKGGLYSW